jgi:hypothetical protein
MILPLPVEICWDKFMFTDYLKHQTRPDQNDISSMQHILCVPLQISVEKHDLYTIWYT